MEKETAKNILFSVFGLLGSSKFIINKLIQISKTRVHVPFYHAINDKPSPHLSHVISVKSQEEFEKDLLFFRKNYNFIRIHELINHVYNNSPLPGQPMILSFDDGLLDAYQFAVPLLEEYNIPAIFFLNPDFIDNKKLFYRHKVSLLVDHLQNTNDTNSLCEVARELSISGDYDSKLLCKMLLQLNYNQTNIIDRIGKLLDVDFDNYLRKNQPYLSSSHIKDLISRGFSIGAHSLDHADFEFLSLKEQIYQATESTRIIAENFSVPYKIFSSPFHNVCLSIDFFDAIFDSEIQLSFGIDGTMTDGIDRNIQRFNMESNKNFLADQLFATYYVVKILRRIIRKDKILR